MPQAFLDVVKTFGSPQLQYLGCRTVNKTHTQYIFSTNTSNRLSVTQFQQFLTKHLQPTPKNSWKLMQWNSHTKQTIPSDFAHVIVPNFKSMKLFSFKVHYSSTQEFGTQKCLA